MKFPRLWRQALLMGAAAFLISGCTLPWKKEQSGIQVQMTDGSSAQVYLDSLHLGQTPIQTQELRPGTYQLRIEPETQGKQAYESQIHLYPGSMSQILWSFSSDQPVGTGDILELEPLPSKERAELSVSTVPEGASISLNSTTYGLSPVILDEVQAGQYSLTINAVGHLKKTMQVQIQNGYRLHIYSRLEKDTPGDAAAPAPSAEASPTPAPSPTTTSPTSAPSILPSPTPVPRGSTATSSAQTSTTKPAKPYVTIKETGTGWLRVRAEANSAAAEVARVNVNESFPYKSTLNGWYEIEYAAGKTGWISGQYGDLQR